MYICCCIWYSTLLCLIVRGSNKMQFDPPPKIRHKGVLGVEHICQDDFYLIRILAFKVESCIFLVYFCYWPNSFMKGDEGGIFSKAPDWKTLFLLKMEYFNAYICNHIMMANTCIKIYQNCFFCLIFFDSKMLFL